MIPPATYPSPSTIAEERRHVSPFSNKTIVDNPLVAAFAFVGAVIWISNRLAHHVTRGRVAGSAIAVLARSGARLYGRLRSPERPRASPTSRSSAASP